MAAYMPERRLLRASLYVRLSKTADATNLSKAGMTRDLRKLCEDRGFVEVALHVDDGKSGAIRDRKEFKEWLADAVEGRADVLVAWHVDRLSREGLNVAATILDVVEGKDPETGKVVRPPVRLIGYDDRLDSADGDGFRLNFVIKAELARAELARMKSRSQARVRRLKAEKRSTGGLTPYGYQRAPRGPMELEHDPVSAPLIQEAVRRVIEGASVGSIAKDFNARGILSPRDHSAMRDTGEPRKDKETGKPLPPQKWTDETLRRMLTNEVLLGRLISNGKVERDDEGKPVMRGEPLISEEDWGALQDAITGAKKPKTRKAPDALLSGVAFCAFCGEVLHFHWAVKPTRGQEYRYYRCSGRAKKNNGCKSDAVRAEALDALVIETVLSMVGDFDIMKKVYIPGDDSAAELADVENRMQDFRDDRAAGLYKGERGTAEFREMYAKLEERREQLEGRDSKPGGWEYISTGVTYRQRWESGDTTERRKTLLDSELRVYATATQNEPLTAVDEYWAKLEAEEGSRAMVAYVPEDAGGFHLVLIWTGNLAERLTGKREATGHPKLTKQGITVKGGLQETAGP